MRPVIAICFLVLVCRAEGQIPRDISGQFEYTGEIMTDNSPRLIERARAFFNQPFMVHWDSVRRIDQPHDMLVSGTGYITVRAKQHGISTPSPIPVSLHLSIEVKNGHYSYTVNHFVVDGREGGLQYPLEEKPDSVKAMVYDQLLQSTHKRVSFMIGWLKRYMKGDE